MIIIKYYSIHILNGLTQVFFSFISDTDSDTMSRSFRVRVNSEELTVYMYILTYK